MDHLNLAETLLDKGSYVPAVAAAQVGLQHSPEKLALRICLGRAYDGLELFDLALAECDAVLALEPAGPLASAANVLKALVYTSLENADLALASARRALELEPDDVTTHVLLGSVLSWHGDLEAALPYIEWNWIEEQRECQVRHGRVPLWTDADAPVGRLLVAHGQGLGDAIQMARYLPTLRRYAERIVVECAPAVLELFRDAAGVDEVIERDRSLQPEHYDAYVRTMTLPRLLGVVNAGTEAAYLRADPGRVARWRARLGTGGRLRVGIVWAGNAGHRMDFQRSIPFEQLASLGEVSGVRWFSLMNGPRSLEPSAQWEIDPIGSEFEDLADAAAVIEQLDLVISVDTAVAHLAGALGRPVWMMLPRRPDWRWGGSGERTPWYSSMRLFRETRAQWTTVVPRIRAALLELVAAQ